MYSWLGFSVIVACTRPSRAHGSKRRTHYCFKGISNALRPHVYVNASWLRSKNSFLSWEKSKSRESQSEEFAYICYQHSELNPFQLKMSLLTRNSAEIVFLWSPFLRVAQCDRWEKTWLFIQTDVNVWTTNFQSIEFLWNGRRNCSQWLCY